MYTNRYGKVSQVVSVLSRCLAIILLLMKKMRWDTTHWRLTAGVLFKQWLRSFPFLCFVVFGLYLLPEAKLGLPSSL